jgi:pyrroloquinoline quinone (PQQ) biosynthesis protein C
MTDLQEIKNLVDTYLEQLKTHPLQEVFRAETTPRSLLDEFAGIQYVDSVLWVPMLAIMKDRAKNPRLVAALRDNLLCEAGADHESHIVLCQRFLKSVGISPFFGNFHEYSHRASHAVEMMNGVSGMSESRIAGFNLMSEAVVPILFKMVLESFRKLPNSNVTYLTDHITVDADDHAKDMMEAVESLIDEGAPVGEIMEGIHLSARTAFSVPDALFSKYLRGGYGFERAV